jgi:hypothetical protein
MTRRRVGKRKVIRAKAAPTRFIVARDALSQAPHVATLWLGDPAYRDPRQTFLPRRLRLRGPGPSLSKLIRRVWPTGDVAQIAEFLIRSGSVRRDGAYYELESRFIPFRADAATALSHTLKTVRSYVDTVAHNMACASQEDTWVERSATNRNIPARAAPLIRRYLRRQVAALTARVDQYLRRLEVEAGSEDTIEIGVNAFAHSRGYLRPNPTVPVPSSSRVHRKSRRRAASSEQ